jgi:pimeloyl-ACP methyl ester carboxylesterase
MGRFAAAGLEVHAVSLRGTSGSPCDTKSVKITEHVADLHAFVEEALDGVPPILVGHSFGGASCLKYLEAGHAAAAAVLLCSVPPSGNGPMTLRFLRRSPRQAWAITRGFAMKAAASDANVCRELFFDESTPLEQIAPFLTRLEADAQIGLDVRHFVSALPSQMAGPDGRATWLAGAPPTLVLGAARDGVVDREANEETAAFLGVHAEFFDMPHDVMLCEGWEAPADRITEFALGQSAT